MSNNSGLVYESNPSSSTIYVNIKRDGTLVKRLKGGEEEKYLKMDFFTLIQKHSYLMKAFE